MRSVTHYIEAQSVGCSAIDAATHPADLQCRVR
jgi:hypothetical protein